MKKINIGFSILVLAFVLAYLSRGIHIGDVTFLDNCLELGTKNIDEKILNGKLVKVGKDVEIKNVNGSSTYDEVGKYHIDVEYLKKGQRMNAPLNLYIVDTTAPKLSLITDVIYQNRKVDLDEVISVNDASNSSTLLSSYHYWNSEINNKKLGTTTFTIKVRDDSGNESVEKYTLEVKESDISLYTYVERNCIDGSKVENHNYLIDNAQSSDDLIVNFESRDAGAIEASGTGSINFTKGTIEYVKHWSSGGMELMSIDTASFDKDGKIISFKEESGFDNSSYGSNDFSVSTSIDANESSIVILKDNLSKVAGEMIGELYAITLSESKVMNIDCSTMTVAKDENK